MSHIQTPLSSSGTESENDFLTALRKAVSTDPYWSAYLHCLWESESLSGSHGDSFSLHLGIFVEPYLQYVLDGSKTIESRFSTRRFAPYQCVEQGDALLLKRSGGPVVGLCRIESAWFYDLEPNSLTEIRSQFAEALRAQDPDFWKQRQDAEFATLMRVGHVIELDPIPFAKRDRRGWVVLSRRENKDAGPLQYEHAGLFADA